MRQNHRSENRMDQGVFPAKRQRALLFPARARQSGAWRQCLRLVMPGQLKEQINDEQNPVWTAVGHAFDVRFCFERIHFAIVLVFI